MKRVAIFCAVLLAGCSSEPPPPPVVVYFALDDARIEAMFEEFTGETGIPVDLRRGSSTELVDALIEKTGDPADILVTTSIPDIWRAADRGALRPLVAAGLAQHHPSLRDPDGLWFAMEIRPHTIERASSASPSQVSYEDLGSPAFAGKVCLSTSALPGNRALLGNLIESKGVLETERLVRRWVRNLAQAPYPGERELRDAIRDGTCEFGIVSNYHTVFGNWNMTPAPHSFAATLVGVGRHAAQADAAQALAEWLLDKKSVRVPSFADLPRASLAGWRDEEARRLAERAGYR